MSICEHDRGIIKDIRDTLIEIRDELRIISQQDHAVMRFMEKKHNLGARVQTAVMQYNLDVIREEMELDDR